MLSKEHFFGRKIFFLIYLSLCLVPSSPSVSCSNRERMLMIKKYNVQQLTGCDI